MNRQHKIIRALLREMAPVRAIAIVKACQLPALEEACVIKCDVEQLSCVEAAWKLNVTEDTVKKRRKKAYIKIADHIENSLPR
jgi:DNA-directed RNA polymerase specialized sigma24 family protein